MEAPASTIPPTGSLIVPSGKNPGTPDPEVVIKKPSPDERVQAEESARGTATNIPIGQTIWLIVQSGLTYYPQTSLPLPPNGTGDWTATVFFGGDNDAGEPFTLYAVAADEAAHSRFNNYVEEVGLNLNPRALEASTGYPNVPALAQVTVFRE